MLYDEYLLNKRPYQEQGHAFLLERRHACLYYKPGKGKTYPCIDALLDVNKAKNGEAKVLILSTADAINKMWNDEIVPQGILPKNTILMSFNAAIVEKTKARLLKLNWDILIVDECHKIKAHNTKSSKLVYMLSKKTPYVWGLSGTPRGNTDLDIFCQFHNMCISDWGKVSYTLFVSTCCDIDKKFIRGNQIIVPLGITSRYREGWLNNIAMYTHRVEYSAEDNMPDLAVRVHELPYTATKEYLQAEQGVVSIPEYETTMTKLAAIQKLHQAVNGFLYVPNDNYEDNSDRKIHFIERNAKLDWIKNNLTSEPTLIVYKFQADLKFIKEELDKNGASHTDDINLFKEGNTNVLLLQCSRCESFNLQMCRHMIFYTMDYSYITYNQMLHRIWRIGQTENVTISVLLFKDTIENKIYSAVCNKEKLADLFMRIKGA